MGLMLLIASFLFLTPTPVNQQEIVDSWKTHLTEQTIIIVGSHACESYYGGYYNNKISVEEAAAFLETQVIAASENTSIKYQYWDVWTSNMINEVSKELQALFDNPTEIGTQIQLCNRISSENPNILEKYEQT